MNTRKLLSVRRKECYNWHINRLWLKKWKKSDNFKEMLKKTEAIKTCKSVRKICKTQEFFVIVTFYEKIYWKFRTSLQKVVVNWNSSNDVEKSWNYSNVCTGSVWKMLQKLNKNK